MSTQADTQFAIGSEHETDADSWQHPFDYSSVFENVHDYYSSRITRPIAWRKTQLNALLKLISDNQKNLSEALSQDLGKCTHESYITEIGYLKTEIKHALKHLKKWMKPLKKTSPMITQRARSYLYPEPLGTVLIIGAWNYPLQLTLSPLVAAIAAGNCAIIKPSELAEQSSAVIAKLLPEYLDKKAFVVVEGGKAETTALLEQPFNKIFYTGGEKVGKIVMSAAAANLCPVTLELGGKSPCVIDNDLDFEVVANRIAWGKWLNAGQTCVAPDYVLIKQESLEEFLEALKKAIRSQYSDDPKQQKEYGRIINKRHAQRLASYLEEQNVIIGGQIDVQERYVSPTILLNPDPESAVMQEEIFGPLLPILVMPSKLSMINFINQRPPPLAAYVFTNDKRFEAEFVDKVKAGNMCINDCMMFMLNHELPFGGVGNSGMGRYHGKYGFETFSHEKSVMRRSFKFENSIRYAPFTWFKKFAIKRFIK